MGGDGEAGEGEESIPMFTDQNPQIPEKVHMEKGHLSQAPGFYSITTRHIQQEWRGSSLQGVTDPRVFNSVGRSAKSSQNTFIFNTWY